VIGIIDYGMGNLHSVKKGFEKVGALARIVREPDELRQVAKIVLPGVGAFADAMQTLRRQGFVEPIQQAAESGKWFLGICLGLQLLFDVSYEDGEYEGLGIIPGKVVRFNFTGREDEEQLKIPHMGWNSLWYQNPSPLYRDIPDGTYVYFVHSYYVVPTDTGVIATTTNHGYDFASSIVRNNIMATQFHPEKSQRLGLQMLQNFARL